MFCFPIKSRNRCELFMPISLPAGADGVLKYEFADFHHTKEATPNTIEVAYDNNLIPKPTM